MVNSSIITAVILVVFVTRIVVLPAMMNRRIKLVLSREIEIWDCRLPNLWRWTLEELTAQQKRFCQGLGCSKISAALASLSWHLMRALSTYSTCGLATQALLCVVCRALHLQSRPVLGSPGRTQHKWPPPITSRRSGPAKACSEAL